MLLDEPLPKRCIIRNSSLSQSSRRDAGQGFKGLLLCFCIAAHHQCQRCRVGLSPSLAGWGKSSAAVCIQEELQMSGSGCLGTETYPNLELPSIGKPGWLSQSAGNGIFLCMGRTRFRQVTAPQSLSCKAARDGKRI